MQGFLKRPSDSHRFADAFHPRRQRCIRLRKFFERKPRHLHHAVIDGRLKACRRFAGDIVLDFIKRVTDCELCRDFRDRKSRCLRRQRAGTRDARVHFNYDHPAVVRIHRKLNVGTAGLHTDLANDRERSIAHDLIFLVGKGLHGRDSDRVAGMHTHRIEILDGTNNHAVVHPIAHHFHLEFFPSDQRFLDQHFVDRREIEASRRDYIELLTIVSDPTAGSAQSERRANDERKSSNFSDDTVKVCERTRHF